MPHTAVGTLDSRILDTLSVTAWDEDREENVVPAYTATALSVKLGVRLLFVLHSLTKLVRRRLVITRQTRCGSTLYKLPDVNHWAWEANAGLTV